ncbi:hypothetical protein JCM1841_007053 [Sporobolomyces salmonicolor]
MFASHRPPPKTLAPSAVSPTKSTPVPPSSASPAPLRRAQPPVTASSPLSSAAPSSPPPAQSPRQPQSTPAAPRPRLQVTTTKVLTRTVTKTVTVPNSRRSKPAPSETEKKRSAEAAAGKGKGNGNGKGKSTGTGRGKVRSDDSEEADVRPTKKPKRATSSAPPSTSRSPQKHSHSRAPDYSSDLDPLTPSDASDGESSALSSADEDYFSGRLGTQKKEEGAAVAVRDPSAREEGGEMDAISAESVVMRNRKAYVEYFADPSDLQRPTAEWAGADVPVIELEYPAMGARERFALLAPKSVDEYNPIEDVMRVRVPLPPCSPVSLAVTVLLRQTILTVLDHFLTPSQALTHFGHTPGAASFASFSAFLNPSSAGASRSSSRAGTPATPGFATPELASVPLGAHPSGSADAQPLLRALERARNKRDGPAFLSALSRYNTTLSSLKVSGVLRENIAAMKGLKEKVWTKVFYQCYDRVVGPDIDELKVYRAFSSNVYGELLPKFLNEIFEKTNLGPNSVFVDLGSGVGNCVVQAALATGAASYGFENMPHASLLARRQVAEAEKRFRMWGLAGGAMRVVEADFCAHPEVAQVMKRADVVLVNNEVFRPELNDQLSYLFLDLPPSCTIVSLKPFLPPSFKISSHNVHSPKAILNQSPALKYKPGSVSWKNDGGDYYVARVDRGRVERFARKEREREEGRRRKREERSASVAMCKARSSGSAAPGSRVG